MTATNWPCDFERLCNAESGGWNQVVTLDSGQRVHPQCRETTGARLVEVSWALHAVGRAFIESLPRPVRRMLGRP